MELPPFLLLDLGEGKRGMYGEINHKLAGQQAGLGDIGLNQLLVTHEYGPYVRLGSIITDAQLEPDTIREGACTDCEACIGACPGKALSKDGIDFKNCTRMVLRWGLPGLIKLAYGSVGDPKAAIGDQGFMELWQNLSTGAFYGCFECMRACPVGRQ